MKIMDPAVRTYLTDIIDAAGYSADTDSEALLEELSRRFDLFMADIFTAALPEENEKEFRELTRDAENVSEVKEYLEIHVKNIPDVVMNGMIAFRELCVGTAAGREILHGR